MKSEVNVDFAVNKFIGKRKQHDIKKVDLLFATKSVSLYSDFFPQYVTHKRNEYMETILNEESIKSGDSCWLKEKLAYMKVFIKLMDSMPLENYLKTYLTHFPKDSELVKATTSPIPKFIQGLKSIFPKRRYPMIYFYTTEEAWRMWFSKRIPISYLSIKERRDAQYMNPSRNDVLAIFIENYNYLKLQVVMPPNDQKSAEEKMIYLYRLQCAGLDQAIYMELQLFSLNHPEYHFQGIVYRGERMKEEDFHNFTDKIKVDTGVRWTGEIYSSFTTNINVAKRFGSSSSSKGINYKRVLHKFHVCKLLDEDVTKIKQLFPESILVYKAVRVNKLSTYDEQEVLMMYPSLHLVNVTYDESSGIYCFESTFCAHEISVFGEYDNEINQNSGYDTFDIRDAIDRKDGNVLFECLNSRYWYNRFVNEYSERMANMRSLCKAVQLATKPDVREHHQFGLNLTRESCEFCEKIIRIYRGLE